MLKENTSFKGIYTFTLAEMADSIARKMQDKIDEARQALDHEKTKHLIDVLNKRYGLKPLVVHNIVPTAGRSVLAQRLASVTTYTGIVNKIGLGTGTATPTNADTKLQTETYRNSAASLTYSDNIAYITGFFTAAETSGTFNECGLFIDGTASADTGQIFSRVLASITKSTAQTLTVDWTLTIS